MFTQLLSKYPDSAQVPSWARKSITTALYEGFINADSTTNLIKPLKPMTRGDMAYALSKYLERQEDTRRFLGNVEEPAHSSWERGYGVWS